MKIGIDFGSTYSTISCFDQQLNTVRAITLQEGGAASIPSVVSINKKNSVIIGESAKKQAGKKTVRLFEAFKMLLTESDQTLLRQRGYDSVCTPRKIAALFLENVIRGAVAREMKDAGVDEIVESAVICVPECWTRRGSGTLDGRMILRDILRSEIDIPVHAVQVVTEPEAASAYFAYNYEKERRKAFNGHLLLIDYGGGTLDITLTEVVSDGGGSMEIAYREGGGEGENHRDKTGGNTIGCAGIAYMQQVVQLALRAGGVLGEQETPDYLSTDYKKAVHDLEDQLRAPEIIRQIEDRFEEYGAYHNIKEVLDEEPEEIISLEYDGEEISVTVQQLYLAYRDVIQDILDEEIRKINKAVKARIGSDPCRPDAGARDDFKIALVGGFGSFYLVRKQIEEIYSIDFNSKADLRVKSINASQRELAISMGAALLAAGKVALQKTARYSIGIGIRNHRGEIVDICYGIKYHQTLEPGKPYFLLQNDALEDRPENRRTWGALYGNIESFMMEFSDRLDRGGEMKLKAEFLDKLRQLPEDGFWQCGFSVDESDVVSFHVVPKPLYLMENLYQEIVIPLDSHTRMFYMTDVKEVEIKHGI